MMMESRDAADRPTLDVPAVEDAPSDGAAYDEPTVENMRPASAWTPRLPRFAATRRPRFPIGRRLPVLVLPPVLQRQRAGAVFLLIALLAGLALLLAPNLPPQIQYAHVKDGNLTLSVHADGVVQSATYDANFVGTGKLAEINVTVGQPVEAGATLAKLDDTLLQDAVNEAQSSVDAAQGSLNSAQAALAKVQAQGNAEIAAAYSKEQSDMAQCGTTATRAACVQRAQDSYAAVQARAESAIAAAQTTVATAQGQLGTAQSHLQTARDNFANATLTAPHAGTIASINATRGSVVGTTTAAGVPFIRIVDLGTLQVLANVAVADVGAAAKGQDVQFSVANLGTTLFHGTVSGVSPLGQTIDGALRYPATIDVDTATTQTSHLLPGMHASLTIVTQRRIGVNLVPVHAVNFARAAANRAHGGFLTPSRVSAALRAAQQLTVVARDTNPDASVGTPAYLLDRVKDTWVLRPVVLGITDGKNYEVLSGLSTNDRIVYGEQGPLGIPRGPDVSSITPTVTR